MKVQFVNDEGMAVEIVPGMRLVLCKPKRQGARYTLVLLAPDGSLLVSAEYLESKRKREIYPIDLGLIYEAFGHLAEGILVLAGFDWRSDYWDWKKKVEERLGVEVHQGYTVLE